MTRWIGCVSLAALALAASGSSRAAVATIRGTVFGIAAGVSDRPAVNALGGATHQPPEPPRAVVYLEWEPRQAFDDLRPMRARMDQRGEQFVPRVLAVTVGSTVEFPNSDTTFHNVFSLSKAKTFDLGRYRPGRTGSVTFDRPGIVPVFCDIHSHMSAYVFVFSHPFFAITDTDGRYVIPNVPAGSYTLVVWSESGRAPGRRVVLTDGENAEIDFRLRRAP